MILDIEIRILTDGPTGAERMQVRKHVTYVSEFPHTWRDAWTDWQDVPRVDKSKLEDSDGRA